MSKVAFSANLASAAQPFIWGSLQNTYGLVIIDRAAPYLVARQPPGDLYLRDSLGRLIEIRYANGKIQTINYDNMGNRTSVVTV